MAEKITLNKEVYSKNQFKDTINTNFTQLVSVDIIPTTSSVLEPALSVIEFFDYYQQLFFIIPKLGDSYSHEYLIQSSTEYIGEVPNSSELNALIGEITQLRQDNLDLQQQIVDLTQQFVNSTNTPI